jgi:hypothetical protein
VAAAEASRIVETRPLILSAAASGVEGQTLLRMIINPHFEEAATAAVVNYDGEYFRLAADHGMPQSWTKQFQQRYRGSDLHERLLRGKRYVQVADARAAAETLQSRATIRAGSRTMLMVPLRKEGALLGLISAHRREVRSFSDNECAAGSVRGAGGHRDRECAAARRIAGPHA